MSTQTSYTKQNTSFWKFLKDGFSIMREENHSKAIISLTLLYFCELASYLAFVLCIDAHRELPVALFSGTMIGGIVFSYIIAMQKMTVKGVLKFSNIIYLLGTIFHWCTWICRGWLEHSTFEWLRILSYFIFGFGFAPTIGLVVSQITEKLPRYTRSFNIGIVHGIGFVSPVIIAAIFGLMQFYYPYTKESITNDYPKIAILFTASIFGILASLLVKNIPRDAGFKTRVPVSVKTWLSWYGLSNNTAQNSKYGRARTFYMSALTGTNMIFFFYLFTNCSKISFIDSKGADGVQNYHTIVFSYLGLVLGSLFWSFMSKKLGSRRRVIIRSNGLQFCVLLIMLAMYFSGQTYNIYQFWPIIFALGFSNSWAIILSQSSEQFISNNRASQMALLPNFFRFAPLFMTFATRINDNDTELKSYATLFILTLAFIFLLVSCVAALCFKDKFGIEPLSIDNEDRSIIPGNLRNEINNIDTKDNNVKYLETANIFIASNFKKKIGGLYYLSNIYHRNEDQSEVISPLLDERLINLKTLEVRGGETNVDKIAFVHSIGDALIREKRLESTSLWIAQSNNISGMMVWNPGRTQVLRDFENPNSGRVADDPSYSIVINLNEIILDKNIDLLPTAFKNDAWIKTYMDAQRAIHENDTFQEELKTDHTDIWFKHIEMLAQKATFVGELADLLQKMAFEKYNFPFDIEKLKLSLLHFKMDAELYQRGSYYRYCIKPYGRKSETITLMSLKTVTALPKKRLGQLRDLMTTLMLEKTSTIVQKKNRELLEANHTMAFEEEHYKKNELFCIQSRLADLSKDYSDVKENSKFIYVKNGINHLMNVASFYMGMMKNKENKDNDYDWINVKEVLSINLKIVLDSLDLLDMNTPGHIAAIEQQKEELITSLEDISFRIHVKYHKAAFNIIVQELIKNAIKYTSPQKPFFTMRWIKKPNQCRLEFINNAKISDENLEYMNNQNQDITNQHFVSGGIRSVRRIIKYFEKSTQWHLVARRSADEDQVIFAIVIPIVEHKESVKLETPTF